MKQSQEKNQELINLENMLYATSLISVDRKAIIDGTYTIDARTAYVHPGAFADCRTLKYIQVASDNPEYISIDGVLFNKTSSILHTYPCRKVGGYEVPSGTRRIEAFAFSGSSASLGHIKFNDDLEEVGPFAFSSSYLEEVIIPENVHTIGYKAFNGCDVSKVYIPASVTSIGRYAFPTGQVEFIVKKNSYALTYLKALQSDVFSDFKITVI